MKKPFKIILKILLILVMIIAIFASAVGIYYGASKSCNLTVKINENEEISDFTVGALLTVGGQMI